MVYPARQRIVPRYVNGMSTRHVKRTWTKQELGKRFIEVVSILELPLITKDMLLNPVMDEGQDLESSEAIQQPSDLLKSYKALKTRECHQF